MWKDIFEIIFNITKSYREKKRENSQRLSNIFGEISIIIDSCIDLMQKDIYPHNYCQLMLALSKDIVDELTDVMDMSKLVELESLLISCSRLELEYATRQDENTINNLIFASARFKSLSILYS